MQTRFRKLPKRHRTVSLPNELDNAVDQERMNRGLKSFSHMLAVLVAEQLGIDINRLDNDEDEADQEEPSDPEGHLEPLNCCPIPSTMPDLTTA